MGPGEKGRGAREHKYDCWNEEQFLEVKSERQAGPRIHTSSDSGRNLLVTSERRRRRRETGQQTHRAVLEE